MTRVLITTLESTTGSVLRMKSDRSFVNPRRAVTKTGSVESNVIVALTSPELNGAWSTKRAICAPAGTVSVFCPNVLPSGSVNENVNIAVFGPGLAMAIPVFTPLFVTST